MGRREDEELAEARLARGRLRATIDGQMDPVMLLDPVLAGSEGIMDFTVVEANVRVAEELGVDFSVLTGAPLSTLLPDRATRFWLTTLADVVNTGNSLALDELPDPGASHRFFDVRALRVGLGVSVTCPEPATRLPWPSATWTAPSTSPRRFADTARSCTTTTVSGSHRGSASA